LVQNSWEQYARAAIGDAFRAWDRRRAALLWNWWTEKPDLFEPTLILIPCEISQGVESDLIETVPHEVESRIREAVCKFSRNRQWKNLHAAVLGAAPDLTAVEKFRRQIAADPDAQSWTGLERIADRVAKREVLFAALELQEPRLLRLASSAAAKEPVLMRELDVSNPAWRSIWLQRAEVGGELFEGIAQPKAVAHALMDAVLAGVAIEPELLKRIAVHSCADLVDYVRRSEIWPKLPHTILVNAQTTTAKSWLDRFLSDPTFDPPQLEPPLQEAIVAQWRSDPSNTRPDAIARVWSRFHQLTERDLLAWLNAVLVRAEPIASVAIGRLAAEKRWTKVAATLLSVVLAGRDDLALAVQECSNLLDFWDRARLAVAQFFHSPTFSEDDWWRAWLDVSADPRGIEDQNIWEEAAGDVSRVRGDAGREQWSHALHMLRRGGAGKHITIEGLLHQMRNDFQNNPDLKLLEDVYLRYFSRR